MLGTGHHAGRYPRYAPRRYDERQAQHGSIRRYFVDSGTREGLRYSVRIAVTADGIQLDCTCESGMAGRVCWHCGAVLMAEGWVPSGIEEAVA